MESTIEQILNKLTNEWAPAVLELGIQMKFWDGVGTIIIGVSLLGLSILLGMLSRYFWRKHRAKLYAGCDFGAVFFGMISVLLLVPVGILLLDIWNWVAIFNPKLALAHDIFERLVK